MTTTPYKSIKVSVLKYLPLTYSKEGEGSEVGFKITEMHKLGKISKFLMKKILLFWVSIIFAYWGIY